MKKPPRRGARSIQQRRDYQRLYKRAHPGWRTAKQQRRARREWLMILAAYGPRCACCGESRQQFLTLDHVNGDGAAERGARGTNLPVKRRLAALVKRGEIPTTYQLLCYNCNCARGARGWCCTQPIPPPDPQPPLL